MSGPAAGYRIQLNHACKLGFLLGSSERAVQDLLTSELTAGDVFYDLGANIGFLALVGARAVGPTGQVVAFEPSARNAGTLRRNMEVNVLAWVEVVEAAVGEASGTAVFAEGDSDQTGRIVGSGESGGPVPVVSLDDWLLPGRRPPDLLKIDVEGAERAVIAGAKRLLREHRPSVICEVHASGPRIADHEVCCLLRQLDYTMEWLEPAAETIPDFWAPHLVARPRI